MFKSRIPLSAVLAAALCGCASAPQSPQQGVFQAKAAYAVALQTAVAYKRLPACSAAVKPPCSDPATVAQLQRADNVAAPALDAAEAAVRTPGFGKSLMDTAVASAQAAVAAFVAILK